MGRNKITYFTPTHNRSTLLTNLYDSLLRQTNKNFIWLIIDDGSTDNTQDLIKSYIEKKEININYIYKVNGGKHTAIDLSNKVCETEYIACIDSDDYLTENATEIILKYIQNYEHVNDICGFVGRRAHYNGTPFSNNWPKKLEKIWFYDLNKKYKYDKDTFLIFKHDIIKNYHFPLIVDEKFITESVFYNQFFYKYKMITMNELMYLAEYQENGYTSQGMDLFFKNPKGFIYSQKQNAYLAIKHSKKIKEKIASTASYYAWKKVLKVNNVDSKYEIPFFYMLIGKILMFKFYKKYKLKFKEFKTRKDKNDES